MIVPGQHLQHVYEAIKQDTYSSEDKGVQVFVAAGDVDSVCASQQVVSIFRKQDIHFSLIPVVSYEAVRNHCIPLHTQKDLKTVVLINCGATEDVRELCQLPPAVRVIIIDSHRPVWHGHNEEADTDTLVLVDDDDPVPKTKVPRYDREWEEAAEVTRQAMNDGEGEVDSGDELDDNDDDGDDDEAGARAAGSDDDDGGERVRSGQKRRRRQGSRGRGEPGSSQGRGEDDGDGDGDGGAAGPSGRHKRLKVDRAELRVREQEIDEYYSNNNGSGKPSALLLLNLCHMLRIDDVFHVWCAIVGLSEHLVLQQVSKQHYDTWRRQLEDALALVEAGDAGGGRGSLADQVGSSSLGPSSARHKVHVSACQDLRLSLLRHWTLEESLKYTGYVASRLQTWRTKGHENVRTLLTFLCIPVKQAQSHFRAMRDCYKEALVTQLQHQGPRHMLAWDQLSCSTFKLQYKQEMEISASDMVYALIGLLTTPPAPGKDHRDAFVAACDALHVQRHWSAVGRGIEAAKRLVRSIVSDGGSMLGTGRVTSSRDALYRHINIADIPNMEKSLLVHPLALRLLAIFLRDACNARLAGTTQRKPLVVAGPPDENGNCYVVAMHAKHLSSKLQNNPFARPFIETLDEMGVVQANSVYDNGVLHLHKDLLMPFLGRLKETIRAYSASSVAQQG